MKKILIAFFVAASIATATVYFYIPKNIRVVSEISICAGAGTAQRIISGSFYRAKWLPATGKSISPIVYELDGCGYRFATDNSINNNIDILYKNINSHSLQTLLPTGNDTITINWMLNEESGYNPFNRLSTYFKLKHIKETNEKILLSLQQFLINKKNVYGFDVQIRKQTDSTLITLKSFVNHFPGVADIYGDIDKLKRYAAANDARTTNAPMLNIERDGPGKWRYMVALAIDKPLIDNGNIIAKRMFAGGKILITDNITGGFTTLTDAMQQLEKYKEDYGYMSPAIPFQSLITDRVKERDTTKWQTKLYYPVY